MTFVWRDALWLLLAVPLGIAGYVLLLRRRHDALRYASVSLVKAAIPCAQSWRRHLPAAIFAAALTAMLLAIARPAAVVTLPSEQRAVVLAIDVSYSMSATDVAPTRLAAAQAAAKSFVRSQPRDVRVGVIAFAGSADLVQRPTTNRAEIEAAIDGLQLQYNTAIGSGLLAALLTIFPEMEVGDYDIFGLGRSPVAQERNPHERSMRARADHVPAVPPGSFPSAAIVLLTDGNSVFGMPPERAARLAADRGVRVYTVGFGSPAEVNIEIEGETVAVGFDERALQDVAQITHGAYFHASTAEELKGIYRTLTGRIVLQRTQRELTGLFAALAAVLLVCSGAMSLAWCGRFA